MEKSEYQILLFYKYVHIEDPEAVKDWQRELAESLSLKGRFIIAHEGINITLEGKVEDTEKYIKELEKDERFRGIHFKRSKGDGNSFPKLSVKVRSEIVSLHLGEEDFSPCEVTGKRLSPEELHEWFVHGKDFVTIDMRNDYETKVGMFKGSIDPGLKNFRDLPRKIGELEHLRDKPIVTVCTGGVRCEKASGYLVSQGFTDIYQLDGGIVSYMEKYPNENFEGKLYVFDKRVTMGFEVDDPKHKVIGKCDRCGDASDEYGDCANVSCPRHLICCTKCRSAEGDVYCSDECRKIVSDKKESNEF